MILKGLVPDKKKFWTVQSEVEAVIFKGMLDEEGISYEFFPTGDSILGSFQSLEKGYGTFQCLPEWEEKVEELWQAFLASAPEAGSDS